ncbi:MAG: hypothetical protein LC808_26390 [Actinobacteria bacterium]|nr:hypothetical protein [Actinomycetota bacterium]
MIHEQICLLDNPGQPCWIHTLRGFRIHLFNEAARHYLPFLLRQIGLELTPQEELHPDTKLYMERQQTAGKPDKEAMRCPKRQLSNVVSRQLITEAKSSISAV